MRILYTIYDMVMKYKILSVVLLVLMGLFAVTLVKYAGPILTTYRNQTSSDNSSMLASARRSKKAVSTVPAIISATTTSKFVEIFDRNFNVEEVSDKVKSSNNNWWISSGGRLISANGWGSTIQGPLDLLDPWRVAFSLSNPVDTDNGYHPQNIFRLVSTGYSWKNNRQDISFKITNDNLSASPNRNASNGILFFNRYKDAFNLYYTGVRVDGYAVIKKKIAGTYYTMAYKPLARTVAQYDKDVNPNLLPKQQWVGLRSEVTTNSNNTVTIKLYTDVGKTGNWVLVAEAIDDGISYGGPIFTEGYGGLRTDFMDVLFDDYMVSSI